MRIFYLVFFVGMLMGCDIFDKDEDIPGFIYIDSAGITTQSFQGANSSNIVDIAAFANNKFLGTFELPATIPTLETGEVNFSFDAGIRNNGMTSDRRIYPFYKGLTKTITVIPEVVVPVSADSSLQFKYFNPGLEFKTEDFESTGYDLIESTGNTAELTQITSPAEDVKDGFTLKVEMTEEKNIFDVRTDWNLTQLPKGNPIYLEIDFKGTAPLHIGVLAVSPQVKQIFALGLVPQEKFTKVYVDLTEKIAREINTQEFELYFSSKLPDGKTNAQIFIDNIKLIYPR